MKHENISIRRRQVVLAGAVGMAAPAIVAAQQCAGTPRDAVTRLSAELSAIVNTPEFRDKSVTPFGFDAVGSTPEQFARFIVEDRKSGEQLAKLAGARQP